MTKTECLYCFWTRQDGKGGIAATSSQDSAGSGKATRTNQSIEKTPPFGKYKNATDLFITWRTCKPVFISLKPTPARDYDKP